MNIEETLKINYFIVNLQNVDIADMLMMKTFAEEDDEEEDEIDDSEHVQELLAAESLTIDDLENSKATVIFKDRALTICLKNNKEYRLSIMEFLGYPKYKELTSYFIEPINVTLKDISVQVGGVIDTNYGFKCLIEIV